MKNYLRNMFSAIILGNYSQTLIRKESFKLISFLRGHIFAKKIYHEVFSTKLLHQLTCFPENYHGCSRYFEVSKKVRAKMISAMYYDV